MIFNKKTNERGNSYSALTTYQTKRDDAGNISGNFNLTTTSEPYSELKVCQLYVTPLIKCQNHRHYLQL